MNTNFSSIELADQISLIPGRPSFERSIEILRLLLDKACEIDGNAPINELLVMDINHSTRDEVIGHSIGIRLASGNGNEALVRYLLVPLGGRSGRGRSIEFASRQFWYAVTNKLRTPLTLRAIDNNTIYAVAEGLFYSKARGNSELGSERERIAASFVSSELVRLGLTGIAKANLNYVRNLINERSIGDSAAYEAIISTLVENVKIR